jgi:hypothetical protein
VLTGTMPIDLKIEQTAMVYQLTKGDKEKKQFDKDMEVRYWQHSAEASISSTEEKEQKGTIHIVYTNGSKTDKGVGSSISIFESGQYIKSIQRRLNKKCTNNQAEQFAILAALQYIESTQRTDKKSQHTSTQTVK